MIREIHEYLATILKEFGYENVYPRRENYSEDENIYPCYSTYVIGILDPNEEPQAPVLITAKLVYDAYILDDIEDPLALCEHQEKALKIYKKIREDEGNGITPFSVSKEQNVFISDALSIEGSSRLINILSSIEILLDK